MTDEAPLVGDLVFFENDPDKVPEHSIAVVSGEIDSVDPGEVLEQDIPQEELDWNAKTNKMKLDGKEIESEVYPPDPGDPEGVTEVDTDWDPDSDEEDI